MYARLETFVSQCIIVLYLNTAFFAIYKASFNDCTIYFGMYMSLPIVYTFYFCCQCELKYWMASVKLITSKQRGDVIKVAKVKAKNNWLIDNQKFTRMTNSNKQSKFVYILQ